MFFAYNNGITATAESIEMHDKAGVRLITGLKNLQIVNGGRQLRRSMPPAERAIPTYHECSSQMKLFDCRRDQRDGCSTENL